jgi:pimeloyl-ACP methyl ester carboxylesterase
MNGAFASGDLQLVRYLAVPSGRAPAGGLPGLVLCHGFPTGPIDARRSAGTFPELMDRVANEMGWAAMTFNFRGCGDSQGDFSLLGWMQDLRAAIDHLGEQVKLDHVWVAGSSTGGSLALCSAVDDERVAGVALLGARADFDDWAGQPRRFLEHARDIGAVRTPGFPPQFDAWARELRLFRPLEAARKFAPRPLLVVHGGEDDTVPGADARQLAEAHGAAELRVIPGAGHRLRHDPRAVAVLLGWLDRQRSHAPETKS